MVCSLEYIEKHPKILFDRCGSNIFLPLRGTNFKQHKTYSVYTSSIFVHGPLHSLTFCYSILAPYPKRYCSNVVVVVVVVVVVFQNPKWYQSSNFDT